MAKIVIEVDTKTGKTNVKDLGDEFKKLDKKVDNSIKDLKKFGTEGTRAMKKVSAAAAKVKISTGAQKQADYWVAFYKDQARNQKKFIQAEKARERTRVAAGKTTASKLAKAQKDAQTARVREHKSALRKIEAAEAASVKKRADGFKKLAGLAAGVFAIAKLKEYTGNLIRIADTYTLIDSKISLGTKNLEEFNKAYEALYQIGRNTGSTLEVNAQAFNKLALSADFDLDELLRSQAILNKSMVVSGATTSEAAGFMLQYAQAMGSGVVNGDELKTMNESNSYIMAKIAKQMDTNIAGLKAMGAANILTSEKFFKALLRVGDEVEDQYGKIPITIARAMNDLKEVWKRILADSNKAGEGTRSVADAISDLADTMDRNRPTIVKFFTSLIDGAGEAVDTTARLLNTFIAFRDYIHRGITPGDYFSLDEESQRQYAEIRDELQQIAQIEKLLSQETGLFQRMLGNGLPLEQVKEFEAHIDKLRQRIEDTLAGKDVDAKIKLEADTSKVETSLQQVNDAFHKSAEDWMATTGKTAEKVVKKYLKEIKKANQEIMEDTRDLAGELSALTREGMTDKEAWNDVTEEITRYRTAAEEAAKAGDWESQLDYLKRAKSLISQLPSEGITIDITDEAVKRAKQLAQSAADAARYHSTTYTRKAAKDAYDAWRKLQAEKKKGGKEEISQVEAINEKSKLTKAIGKGIIAVKKANLEALKKEAAGFEETFKIYKEELETVKESTQDVVGETKVVGDTWVEVGGEWKRVSAAMVSDVNEVNSAVVTLANNLKKVEFKKNAAGAYTYDGARANGGDVKAGKDYLTGERGVEIFTPKHDGTIIPNNQITKGNSRTVDINLKINDKVVPLQGTRQSADMLVREFEEMQRMAS